MKNQNGFFTADEISGKEDCDYIIEFSPHRLTLFRYEEDSETVFDANEPKTGNLR